MKKFLLLPIFGLFFISCSVDPIETEIQQSQLLEMNAVSDGEEPGCAGADGTMTITYSEAAAIESWDEVRKLYLSLLEEGVYRGGEFDPTIWDLINKFNDPEEGGLGDYTTWYTIDNGECMDTVMLTVTVVADQSAPTCDNFTAGEDNSMIITQSEAEAIESWDEVRKLYLSLLEEGVIRNGDFDPSIWDLINKYNDEEVGGPGDYTTEYTVTNGECTDSVMLTITVVADEQSEPVCDGVDAGADNSRTITYSEAAAIESWDEVRKLYLSLLEPGIARNGNFDPSIWDLINRFNDAENGGPGDYPTTYILTNGECTDTVTLTITVVPDEE
ncbi:hypothetical protein FHG64_03945 [Antarcticibacterium flavum]|uniref:Uncharacterized protein n=1 Tax=Antarcticibacterium flavum TaxID=2058175 RepID=A0A5B7X1N1_9FLAO|nr:MULTISPECIES: hypothetical protein [Antarcticibacterium]MCM4158761.1 hypothetical protein [Antarcticibacterium sp. W02-3]QCY68612.1 hypothetical protein FHG64_03945 [Antarcticibacterium flavum]